ncbi:hypothetical protein N7G274_002496 [Stereocaulon virgatum]|uniref:Uncharacterized protein n=1 Tax=Stereocaulon virgatum TaxID=373712 RepID=A0ABR4AFX5_9LECA
MPSAAVFQAKSNYFFKNRSAVDSTILYYEPSCWQTPGTAPIAEVSDCVDASYQIAVERPTETFIVWDTKSTWIFGSCKIDLFRESSGAMDRFTRSKVILSAWQVSIQCGTRGGMIYLSGERIFTVELSGVHRTGSMETRSSVPAKILERDQPSRTNASITTYSQLLSTSSRLTSANNNAHLAEEPVNCWPGPPSRLIPVIRNATDCLFALNQVEAEGPPDQPVFWKCEQQWISGSCAVRLTCTSASRRREDTFTRNDIVHRVERIHETCGSETRGFLGGYALIGGGAFHVTVLRSAQSNSLPAKPVVVTASNANMTSLGFFFPVCFSATTAQVFPVKDVEECYTAVLPLYSEGAMQQPVSWTSQREWRFQSCMVVLEPIAMPIRADTFPRNAIVYAIAQIALECITEARGYLGGFLRIGIGRFMVIVGGIPTASVLEAKGNSISKPSKNHIGQPPPTYTKQAII